MVAEITNENSAYLSALRELMKVSGEPLWLRELRGRSFDRFERVGFPGVEQEEWKYTNVAPIKRTKFTPVVNSNGTALSKRNGLAPFIYDETRDSTFVFVNGIFREDLSSSQGLAGVVALVVGQIARGSFHGGTVRRFGLDNEGTGFTTPSSVVPQDVINQVEDIRARIRSGAITTPDAIPPL